MSSESNLAFFDKYLTLLNINMSTPPLIQGSEMYNSLEVISTNLIEIVNIIPNVFVEGELDALIITDGIATLTNGFLSNLNSPIDPLDCATKKYVDDNIADPGAPLNSVQFNNSGSFNGSSLLTFISNVLHVDETGSGSINSDTVMTPSLNLYDTVNKINIIAPMGVSPYDLILPSNSGSVNQFLTTDGLNTLSWTDYLTGSNNNILYAGMFSVFSSSNNLSFTTSLNTVNLITNITTDDLYTTNLILNNGANSTMIKSSMLSSSYSLSLPINDGALNNALSTNGAGLLSWIAATVGSAAGANTQIQFNNAGAFDASSLLTFDQGLSVINKIDQIITKDPSINNSIDIENLSNIYVDENYIYSVTNNPNPENYWVTQSNSVNNNWSSVTWSDELNIFVAVASGSASGNRVMTSSDSITWITRVSAEDNTWNYVTWSPELNIFAAVASSGSNRVMTSPDGITWTTRLPPALAWRSITWSPQLSIFCAVGSSGPGRALTSSDGITWISRSTPVANTWQSVTWAENLNLFVAVANGTSSGNRVMTSPDGINWTSRVSAADNGWRSVTWSSELNLLVSVAESGGATTRVMTSSDGITWITRVSAATNSWQSITWSPDLGLFCVVAISGTGNRIMTSPDGITWTTQSSATDNSWNSITWSKRLGIFCAVSTTGTGNRIMTNISDSLTSLSNFVPEKSIIDYWTTRQSAADNSWNSVTWSKELNLFCAVAQSGTGNRVMTSPDGVTWTTRASAVDNLWTSVTWSKELNLFCAVASSGTGTRVMTSPDGVTWTTRASAANNLWTSVTWSKELNLFCAVAYSGTGNRIMTSPDGIIWTTRVSAADNIWNSVTWSSDLSLFCAVGQFGTGNRVMTSPDGIIWTTRASAADNDWHSVAWSSELNLFCAVAYSGTGNRVMTSPDGITWTIRSSAEDSDWLSVAWSKNLNLFVAVASLGTNRAMISYNGIDWITISVTANQWDSVIWSEDLGIFCAVAYSGSGNRVMTTTPYFKKFDSLYRYNGLNSIYTSGSRAYITAYKSNVVFSVDISNPSSLSLIDSSPITQPIKVISSGPFVYTLSESILTVLTDDLTIIDTLSISNAVSFYLYTYLYILENGSLKVVTTPYLSLLNTLTNANLNNATDLYISGIYAYVTTNAQLTIVDISSLAITGTLILANLKSITISGNYAYISAEDNFYIVDVSDPTAPSLISTLTSAPYIGSTPSGIYTSGSSLFLSGYESILALDTLGVKLTSADIGNLQTESIDVQNSVTVSGSVYIKDNLTVSETMYSNGLTLNKDSITKTNLNLTFTTGISANFGIDSMIWVDELQIFVTCSNPIRTSPDGITWTTRTTPSMTYRWAVWSPELELICMVSSNTTTSNIITSPDGVTWTTQNSSIAKPWYGVTWSSERLLFCAVALDLSTTSIVTSKDGITWTTQTSSSTTTFRNVAWSNTLGLFAAVGSSGTNRVQTSSDGVTWTTRTAPSLSWIQITWAEEIGIFCAITNDASGKIMTSSDGITWTTRFNIFDGSGISWSPDLGIFLTVGTSGAYNYSQDGINWTTITGFSDGDDIVWSPYLSYFLGRSSSSGGFYRSNYSEINSSAGKISITNAALSTSSTSHPLIIRNDMVNETSLIKTNINWTTGVGNPYVSVGSVGYKVFSLYVRNIDTINAMPSNQLDIGFIVY